MFVLKCYIKMIKKLIYKIFKLLGKKNNSCLNKVKVFKNIKILYFSKKVIFFFLLFLVLLCIMCYEVFFFQEIKNDYMFQSVFENIRDLIFSKPDSRLYAKDFRRYIFDYKGIGLDYLDIETNYLGLFEIIAIHYNDITFDDMDPYEDIGWHMDYVSRILLKIIHQNLSLEEINEKIQHKTIKYAPLNNEYKSLRLAELNIMRLSDLNERMMQKGSITKEAFEINKLKLDQREDEIYDQIRKISGEVMCKRDKLLAYYYVRDTIKRNSRVLDFNGLTRTDPRKITTELLKEEAISDKRHDASILFINALKEDYIQIESAQEYFYFSVDDKFGMGFHHDFSPYRFPYSSYYSDQSREQIINNYYIAKKLNKVKMMHPQEVYNYLVDNDLMTQQIMDDYFLTNSERKSRDELYNYIKDHNLMTDKLENEYFKYNEILMTCQHVISKQEVFDDLMAKEAIDDELFKSYFNNDINLLKNYYSKKK